MSKDQKAAPAPAPLRVRATRDGFYAAQRIRKGMTFTLAQPEDYSDRWMDVCDASVPDDLAALMGAPRPQATPKRTSVSIGNERMAAPLPRPIPTPKPTARAAAAGDDSSVI